MFQHNAVYSALLLSQSPTYVWHIYSMELVIGKTVVLN